MTVTMLSLLRANGGNLIAFDLIEPPCRTELVFEHAHEVSIACDTILDVSERAVMCIGRALLYPPRCSGMAGWARSPGVSVAIPNEYNCFAALQYTATHPHGAA